MFWLFVFNHLFLTCVAVMASSVLLLLFSSLFSGALWQTHSHQEWVRVGQPDFLIGVR